VIIPILIGFLKIKLSLVSKVCITIENSSSLKKTLKNKSSDLWAKNGGRAKKDRPQSALLRGSDFENEASKKGA